MSSSRALPTCSKACTRPLRRLADCGSWRLLIAWPSAFSSSNAARSSRTKSPSCTGGGGEGRRQGF